MNIEAYDHSNTLRSLEDFKAKTLIIYFYPKAMTSGCTKQACRYREHYAFLQENDIDVIGVSPDMPDKLAKFQQTYDLPFTLLSDPEKCHAKLFGVWKEKSMYGRKYMGIERSTFVLDVNRDICHQWRKVQVAKEWSLVKKELNLA